jgi:hypothetical protein
MVEEGEEEEEEEEEEHTNGTVHSTLTGSVPKFAEICNKKCQRTKLLNAFVRAALFC